MWLRVMPGVAKRRVMPGVAMPGVATCDAWCG